MNNLKGKAKILYIIHTPPPVHGVSSISQFIFENEYVNRNYRKKLIRLNLSTQINQLRRIKLVQFFQFAKIFLQLWKHLIFYRPNLIYFTIMPVGVGFFKDALLVLIIKLFRKHIVFHIHNRGIPNYSRKKAFSVFYRTIFKNCSIIHLSEGLVLNELKPHLGNTNTYYSCENSVCDLYLPNKRVKPTKKLNILFFSNLFAQKGLRPTLKAVSRLHNKNIAFNLVIAGSPTKESTQILKEYHQEHPKCHQYLKAIGATFGKEKQELFNQADIFVFPSEFKEECMPLVILEALSAGLPVIASNIGAIGSTVFDGINGFLIPEGNSELLANKIEVLAKHRQLRYKMGVQSRNLYLSKFTPEMQQKKIRAIFEANIRPNS